MPKTVDEIIIDTNLLISFLITKDFKQLDTQIVSGRVKLLFSQELIEEFISVTSRPKFRKYFSKEDIEQIIDLFDVYGKFIKVTSLPLIADIDPKDIFLLALAKNSKADYLITGDKELLALNKFEGTQILQMSDYLKIISKL